MKEIRGSSPPVRGARQDPLCGGALRGLIPACAGSTNREGVIVVIHGAHPRSRREHKTDTSHPLRPSGSSPPVRGARDVVVGFHVAVGLIPACAGNTEFWTCALTAAWAHPRSRGEHMPLLLPKLVESGSSPLARGTRLMARYGNILLGLIPARAGDTPVPRRSYTMFRAHPRSRGEHLRHAVDVPGD